MPIGAIVTELRYVNNLSTTGKFFIVAGTYGRGIYVRELNDQPITNVKDHNITADFSLSQNYPNPFNPVTTIRFSLPKKDNVEIKVYDIEGREITTLLNNTMSTGAHEVKFDGSHLASGVYVYRIRTSHFTESKKMILLK